LDSVKAYAKEKYNTVVNTIHDWKEAAAIMGQVISDPTTLQRFSDDVWYNFKQNTFKRLTALLNKIGLGNLISQITSIVDKITHLTGWQKFLAATGIGAIVEYIVDKMASLAPDAIKNFISSFLSETGLQTIISKLTDFQSYIGWLQPIIKGVDMLYAILKSSIDKFKISPQTFTQNINLVKKEGIQESMKLKELIKKLTQEILDEESVSGDAGGFMTPRAFAKKGQKTNAATQVAGREGFKKVKESNYDKISPSSAASGYTATSGYTGGGIKGDDYYKKDNMKESLKNIIEQELINEVTYSKFKKEVSYRTKTEMLHKGIKEVKRKLAEIDRIVEYTSRMKQELSEGEEGIKYWKATEKNVAQISEMISNLNNKIKNLHQ
jgi:hypothetical protein